MRKIIILLYIGIGLFVAGGFTGYILGLPDKTKDTTQIVKTTQLSGEKIQQCRVCYI